MDGLEHLDLLLHCVYLGWPCNRVEIMEVSGCTMCQQVGRLTLSVGLGF